MSLIIDPFDILAIAIDPSQLQNEGNAREVLRAIEDQENAIKQLDRGLISIDDLLDCTEMTGIDMDDYVDTVLQNIEMVEKYGIKT